MKKKIIIFLSLVITYIVTPIASYAQTISPQIIKNPVDIIITPKKIKDYLKEKNRYTPPKHILTKIKDTTLTDQEKGDIVLKWFIEKDKKFLRQQIRFSIIWRITLLTFCAMIYLFLFGKQTYEIAKNTIKVIFALFTKQGENISEYTTELIKSLFDSPIFKWTGDPGNWLSTKINNFMKNHSNLAKFTSVVTISLIALLLSLPYKCLKGLFKIGYETYLLLVFYWHPTIDNILENAEHNYMRSYARLFNKNDTRQCDIIEEGLFSARNAPIPNVSELELFIKTYIALPYALKPMQYNQERIDELFSTYPPEIKKIAEEFIALMVTYTEAIAAGQTHLVEKLNIKPLLLYGPPGTGKSHFAYLLGQALNITPIILSITNLSTNLTGQSGEKIGSGTPSLLAQACLKATDKNGWCYLNQFILINDFHIFKNCSTYFYDLLDPTNNKMIDEYLGCFITIPIHICATSNRPYQMPKAILDRSQLVRFKDLPKAYKKKIVDTLLIPHWVALLSNKKLHDEYGHYLDADEFKRILRERLYEFINYNNEIGMRSIESKAKSIAMELMITKLKVDNNKAQKEVPEKKPSNNNTSSAQ